MCRKIIGLYKYETIPVIFVVLLVLIGVESLIEIKTWYLLFVVGMAYAVFYFAMVYHFCFNEYEKSLVKGALRKIQKK